MSSQESPNIKSLCDSITTFTTPFDRFAPLGRSSKHNLPTPTFIAVGNRATAILLQDSRILLLNPIALTPQIRQKLQDLGGVDFLACDLGHHMFVVEYLEIWPRAKTIGVPGLEGKRGDVKWDWIYPTCSSDDGDGDGGKVGKRFEDVFNCQEDIRTVLFSGFITNCIAWYHIPSRTLIVSDLLMNLPCTEQYSTSSATTGIGSWAFSQVAHPRSNWFRRLIWYIATVDYELVRRDAKKVAEWDVQRIVPCHGDVIEEGSSERWREAYEWFLEGGKGGGIGWYRRLVDAIGFMRLVRWVFLM